jgi:hypothetical protein
MTEDIPDHDVMDADALYQMWLLLGLAQAFLKDDDE